MVFKVDTVHENVIIKTVGRKSKKLPHRKDRKIFIILKNVKCIRYLIPYRYHISLFVDNNLDPLHVLIKIILYISIYRPPVQEKKLVGVSK